MNRDEVEQELNQADTDQRIRRELKVLVKEISTNVPGDKTQGMMFDLVHVVLELDERVKQLEYRVAGGSVGEELRRQQMGKGKRKPYFNRSE